MTANTPTRIRLYAQVDDGEMHELAEGTVTSHAEVVAMLHTVADAYADQYGAARAQPPT